MSSKLASLKSGELVGSKELKIAEGLTEFPMEIITLADSLEYLDLSNNQISELPDSFAQLKKLKVLFFGNNRFIEFPRILASCPALKMIGFKSNKMEAVPENAFPPLLHWLILTDNRIANLPKSIGSCHLLQKCALAGNKIEELPDEMSACSNLELLRISANNLKVIPNWLFELPKLSWVAFGGNPSSHRVEITSDLEAFSWMDFNVQQVLGQGASGVISKANWISKSKEVAIKVFKGEVTSDGLPEDEMDVAIVAGNHNTLVPVLGKITNHPEGKNGLIMDLIGADYVNLGNPPTLDTCTRDVFSESSVFTEQQLLKITKSIASVCMQLHARGINHGDLYAHNIMFNSSADCLLGDYGAASFYDVSSTTAPNIERIEVKAFGHLVEDVLGLVPPSDMDNNRRQLWFDFILACTNKDVKSRLSFSAIVAKLNSF